MYDPIFSKSFSRNERRRFGLCGALLLCFIVGLSISSTFKPHLRPLSLLGEAANLQLSINAVEDLLMNFDNSIRENSERTEPTEIEKKTVSTNKVVAEPITLCRILEAGGDYCEIEGDIRIHANSSTIFVVKPPDQEIITISQSNSTNINNNYSWTIQPYPRRGVPRVKQWTVKLVKMSDNIIIPKCDQNHSHLPAILFSLGGYLGNYFHDFADVIFPLYTISFHFQKEVQFLVTDSRPWWKHKYKQILNELTRHQIMEIDVDRKNSQQVHCYNKIVAGLKFHREFINNNNTIDPSMQSFRQLLRRAYSLERERSSWRTPRLIIISRKTTRVLTNEDEVSRMAKELGFEVVLAAPEMLSANLSRFAEIVNSCDVMMGNRGAGLTNMVFLPDKAVLIQVLPMGEIEGFARVDFGNPAPGMNMRYLEYKIGVNESSLTQQYPLDHPIIKDPVSFHKKEWMVLRSVYLDNQNVTIDVPSFKGTLVRALRLLRR